MSALRLCVLVVLGATCCVAALTSNPATPECALLADEVKEHIEDKLAPVKAAIEDVQHTVEEACTGSTAVVDVQAASPPFLPGRGAAEITRKLETLEGELSEVKQAVASLNARLEEKTKDLATLKSVRDLQNTIVNLMTNTLLVFESQLEELPKTTQVEALVKEQTEHVKEAVKEVQEVCGSSENLDGLAVTVRELNGHVEETKEAAQETRRKVEECVQQDVTEELRGVAEKVDEVALRVGGLGDDLKAQTLHIGGKVEELTNTTHGLVTALEEIEKQEPASTTEPTIVPTYPCLDSIFTGSANATCQLAVRFLRCSLPKVSYHCCRTCTDAGLLPETGPWRHQNLPRAVTTLETIRFFSP